MRYLIDPKLKQPSVSLTMMMISFAIVSIVSVLQVFKAVEAGGMSLEVFVATAGLYFGRLWTNKGGKNGQTISVNQGTGGISEESSTSETATGGN